MILWQRAHLIDEATKRRRVRVARSGASLSKQLDQTISDLHGRDFLRRRRRRYVVAKGAGSDHSDAPCVTAHLEAPRSRQVGRCNKTDRALLAEEKP
jgi:hypothetical protein